MKEQNVIQVNGGITINVDESVKSILYVKKNMFGILVHAFVKYGKYLAGIIDDSAIICDEVMDADAKPSPKNHYDETKAIPTNFNEKKVTFKMQSVYILLAFY